MRRNDPLERGNPQELEGLATEAQGGSDEAAKLPQRLERYGKAKARALANVAYLMQLYKSEADPHFRQELQDLVGSIDRCGSFLLFRHYFTVDRVRLSAADFCKRHLLCPLCAIRRGSKAMKSYLDRFEYLRSSEPSLRFSMVTLTVKNGDDLLERFTHLKNGVSALLKRRNHAIKGRRVQTEWAKVRGLVGSYEVTNKGNGWHPHVHMIALHSERLDYSAMIDEWRRITGDSYILHVDEARNPHDPVEDFLEVFKYALKFSDLSPELNFEAYRVLSGRRLLFSAGAFRGVVVPEDLLDEQFDDLPYVELLYRYVGGGYNIIKYDGKPVGDQCSQ